MEGGPQFFIIGAQKAGTTTLAALLDAVPGISLSQPKEPMFFCFDDARVHRNEVLHEGASWSEWMWGRDRQKLLERYRKCFAHATRGDLLGEASTSYGPSRKAAGRIAEVTPEARIVMVLRDPLKRAESAYWHGVRKGLFVGSFEEEIRFGGAGLMEFGFYEEQLRRYAELFGRERVAVVHFEDLVREPRPCVEKLLQFLEVEGDLPEGAGKAHLNESYYPRFPRFHRRLARWMRSTREMTKASSLLLEGGASANLRETGAASQGGLRGLYRSLAMTTTRPATTSEEVRTRLRNLFRRENAGLSEFLGEDAFTRWGWD